MEAEQPSETFWFQLHLHDGSSIKIQFNILCRVITGKLQTSKSTTGWQKISFIFCVTCRVGCAASLLSLTGFNWSKNSTRVSTATMGIESRNLIHAIISAWYIYYRCLHTEDFIATSASITVENPDRNKHTSLTNQVQAHPLTPCRLQSSKTFSCRLLYESTRLKCAQLKLTCLFHTDDRSGMSPLGWKVY
jgi:hypothetical protein